MKEARLRALTHISYLPHLLEVPVEMKEARLRALTHCTVIRKYLMLIG